MVYENKDKEIDQRKRVWSFKYFPHLSKMLIKAVMLKFSCF